MKKLTLWMAQFESANFFFEGVGYSEQQARVVLNAAIRTHCRATGARAADFFVPEEVYVRELKPGSGYRDREPITTVRGVRCAS